MIALRDCSRAIELPEIETPRLILRMGREADAPEIVRFHRENNEFLAPWSPQRDTEYFSERFWRGQVKIAEEEFRQDRSLKLFLFHRKPPDRIIGVCNFANFVRGVGQFCTVGYGLAGDAQGRGYMLEAMQAAIPYVFGALKLHRISAGYMPRNERSARLLRRLGFTVEGYARDYIFINGKWEDHILTGLVNPDWRPEPQP